MWANCGPSGWSLRGLSHGILSYLEETRETLRFEGSVFRTSQYACNTDWSVDISQGEIKYKEPTNSTTLHSDIRDVEFITFGIVLIVWEVLPTFMFVWFFRVRRPNVGDMVSKSEWLLQSEQFIKWRRYFKLNITTIICPGSCFTRFFEHLWTST